MDNYQSTTPKVKPHEISKTLEHALHLYKGDHDRLPELLKDAGALLLRFSRKLSTPQLILAVGIVACGVALVAVNIARQQEEEDRQSGVASGDFSNQGQNYGGSAGGQGAAI